MSSLNIEGEMKKIKCKNGHVLGLMKGVRSDSVMCDGCLKPNISSKLNYYFKCDSGCSTDLCPCCYYLTLTGRTDTLKQFREAGERNIHG